jgi:hypothetical protein
MSYPSVSGVLAVVALFAASWVCQQSPEAGRLNPASGGANQSGNGRGGVGRPLCGTVTLPEREVDLVERMAQAERRRRGLPEPDAIAAAAPIGTIKVVFHCIYSNNFGSEFGRLTQAQIDEQINVLNDAFDNVEFELVATTFTNNSDWFLMTPSSAAERNAKVALGWNSQRFLNVYSCFGGGLLGWATFPWSLSRNPSLDGVVIAFDSIPGGTAPYDEGDTLVHEVGHWCGLYHTFQGGCSRRNDRVADTPAEASPNFGCPAARDTCTSPGLDPVQNYMDYSTDVCLNTFSSGQVSRMNSQLQTYRSAIFAP